MNKLFIVMPCYNEEEVLVETTTRITEKLNSLVINQKIDNKSMVLYVNDGSKDNTWNLIQELSNKYDSITGISLSRNRGHQNALLAGLSVAKEHADIIISMDADLQDDINAIDEMIEKYQEGNQIVYGVRSSRKKDTWFKRSTAEGFYKFMKLMGVDFVFNHADYRLTSKAVLNELFKYNEVNLILRGIFPLIGYKSDIVYYERNERFASESKYPLRKMLSFAWNGITSFSVKPITLVFNLGFLILITSLFVILYSVLVKFIGKTVDGWTFIVCSMWLLGGIQMISIGLIGEYIGKIYSETKARPKFVIEHNLVEGD